jgi:hypothetical protein
MLLDASYGEKLSLAQFRDFLQIGGIGIQGWHGTRRVRYSCVVTTMLTMAIRRFYRDVVIITIYIFNDFVNLLYVYDIAATVVALYLASTRDTCIGFHGLPVGVRYWSAFKPSAMACRLAPAIRAA